ncbi:MAG: methylenetetrahydrofolate reductase [NAD(P)H] [Parvibaculales bacterium]
MNIENISFEFFPPKSEEMENKLLHAVSMLEKLKPYFVSVTYGAGGSTRERTHKIVKYLVEKTSLNPAAHLTCVGASREETNAVIQSYYEAGIRHIVALRGDMPDMGNWVAHEEGYKSSIELCRAISEKGGFDISVAAYPEPHPDSRGERADMEYLKAKEDAGARRAITQFALDTEAYLKLRDRVKAHGVGIPIIPGIIPTGNFLSLCSMAEKCGASIPQNLKNAFSGHEQDKEACEKIAHEFALQQCMVLQKEGFESIHIYTLNRAGFTLRLCEALGFTP